MVKTGANWKKSHGSKLPLDLNQSSHFYLVNTKQAIDELVGKSGLELTSWGNCSLG